MKSKKILFALLVAAGSFSAFAEGPVISNDSQTPRPHTESLAGSSHVSAGAFAAKARADVTAELNRAFAIGAYAAYQQKTEHTFRSQQGGIDSTPESVAKR